MNESIKQKLDTFLWVETELPKIIVIYGPTACGKTALSLDVAKYLNTEIISVDSRQIYRHMDIGTGKITREEMQGIPHHMLDVIDPTVKFSVVDFVNMGLPIVEKIQQQGKIPILCGGTWLYIDGILYEMAYPDTKPDWEYREKLEKIRLEEGNEVLWKMLESVDPEYAHELEVNNFRYVMRGLEVWHATGKSKRESKDKKKARFAPLFLTPYTDDQRPILYERINKRVENMFTSWLIDEIKYIANTFGSDCLGLATIGYKEVVEYLHWELSLEACIAEVQQHNRNYAKRQITWNKKYDCFSF